MALNDGFCDKMDLRPLEVVPQRIPSAEHKNLVVNTGFPEIINDRILKAARGEEVDKIPV